MTKKYSKSRLADEIKRQVSMPDIMRTYGIAVNRSGYSICPFHSEKTGSLRVYDGDRGWHCFGCGAGGSVIDFVMQYFDIGLERAIFKIIYDCQLNIPCGKKLGIRERAMIADSASKRQAEIDRARRLEASAESDYWETFDDLLRASNALRAYAPQTPAEEWNEKFVSALLTRSDKVYNFSCAQTALQIIIERGRSDGKRDSTGVS